MAFKAAANQRLLDRDAVLRIVIDTAHGLSLGYNFDRDSNTVTSAAYLIAHNLGFSREEIVAHWNKENGGTETETLP